jgi:hypothetical protein
VASIRRRAGNRLPIIGVGGVFTGDDAFAKIARGASLVQIHSGMVFRGPGIVRGIEEELCAPAAREGLRSTSAEARRDARWTSWRPPGRVARRARRSPSARPAVCGRMRSSSSARRRPSSPARRCGAPAVEPLEQSLAMRAATSAPSPKLSASSCTTSALPVFLTDSADAVHVERRDRAQVDHLGLDPCSSDALLGRVQAALHERAARDEREVRPLAHHLGLAEGDHEVGPGSRPLL